MKNYQDVVSKENQLIFINEKKNKKIKHFFSATPNVIRHFSQRTHTTSDLNKQIVGKTVSLCGWVNAKRVGRFVVLKDGYGSVQIVPNGQNASLAQKFPNLHLDSIVVVKGIVSRRPPGHENPVSYLQFSKNYCFVNVKFL